MFDDAEYGGLSRDEVVEGLQNPDIAARVRFIDQVSALGEPAAAALGLAELLVPLCRGDNTEEQAAALVALGKLGREGLKHIGVVTGYLSANDPVVVAAACRSVGYMADAEQHGSAVAGCLKSKDSDVRASAAVALGLMKAKSYKKDLTDCLKDPAPAVTQAACGALAALGKDAESAAADVAKILSHQDPDSKVAALGYFATVEGAASKLGAEICQCLGDADAGVRAAAVAACSALAGKAVTAKDVAKLLASGGGGAKCAAAVVLGGMGQKASDQAGAIAKLLDDGFDDKQSAMLSAACIMGKQPASLRIAKCAAAEALSKLGNDGAKSAEKVAKLLADGNGEVREYAAEALGRMGAGGAKYEAQVMALFADRDLRAASGAIRAVGSMGQATGGSSPEAVEGVVKMLKSQHPCIRASAATALGTMGDNVFPCMGKLVKCFGDRCGLVRAAVVGAVAKLGVKGHMYAVNVGNCLGDSDAKVRVAALESLALMGGRGAALLEDIADSLADPEVEVRVAALRTIGAFGKEAVALHEAVDMMRSDAVESVRSAATAATEKMM